jgi:hypothetical protein
MLCLGFDDQAVVLIFCGSSVEGNGERKAAMWKN